LEEWPINPFCASFGLVWPNLTIVFYYPTNDSPQTDDARHIKQNERIGPIDAARQDRFIQVIAVRNPPVFSDYGGHGRPEFLV